MVYLCKTEVLMNTLGSLALGDFGILALTIIGGLCLALAIGFSVFVWYKEAYTEEGFLTDKDKENWKA